MSRRPNVILINCDDLGYGDLGCYGSTQHRTPALDQMADEGVRFTDFYMASPVCSPSRAAMLTGSYPLRVGFGGRSIDNAPVLFPGQAQGLHPDEITIARLLQDAGYATRLIGKWHCGDQPEFQVDAAELMAGLADGRLDAGKIGAKRQKHRRFAHMRLSAGDIRQTLPDRLIAHGDDAVGLDIGRCRRAEGGLQQRVDGFLRHRPVLIRAYADAVFQQSNSFAGHRCIRFVVHGNRVLTFMIKKNRVQPAGVMKSPSVNATASVALRRSSSARHSSGPPGRADSMCSGPAP